MLQVFNQNYAKILKNLPKQLIGNLVKTSLNFLIFVYWIIIILGTFLTFN
jgi:hypothetical protein